MEGNRCGIKMKKFLGRIIFIWIGAAAMFLLINVAYYKFTGGSRNVASEVYEALERAGRNEGYTKLVLGDSVARQIFAPQYQEEDDETCYLATNQAIMTAGNYILLERFIENNPQLEEVYYIARPDSLMSEVNFVYTYSYFVTPLYREPLTQCLEAGTKEDIDFMFGRLFAQHEFPKWLLGRYPKLLDLYQNTCRNLVQIRKHEYKGTDMPLVYIQKMKAICDEHHIVLHILSSPLPNGFEYDAGQMKQRFVSCGAEKIFEEFEKSIIYVDEENFVDGIHMEDSYLDEMRIEMKTHFQE